VVSRRHEVVVVDNASSDGSPQLVREEFPSAILLALQENRGFGAGANAGMRAAGGRYFVLLNPDAWPVGDALERLVGCAERSPRAGAVGPRLIGQDGRPQVSVLGFPTRWWTGAPAVTMDRRRLRPRHESAERAHDRLRRGGFLVAAALLLRREAVEAIGGFDPDFFMFNEEVDLCFRLRQAGWTLAYCPEAEFVHVGGAATRAEWTKMYRSQVRGHLRFLAKHRGHEVAEGARRYLLFALRARGLLGAGDASRAYRETASWLRSAPLAAVLGPGERTAEREGRTNGSAR
jgi:GT2 family glycosyltransferase